MQEINIKLTVDLETFKKFIEENEFCYLDIADALTDYCQAEVMSLSFDNFDLPEGFEAEFNNKVQEYQRNKLEVESLKKSIEELNEVLEEKKKFVGKW
jgi:uncharacterized protein Yka (UPF0111/DUF47 family)